MTPKWIQTSISPEGYIIAIDDTGRMFCSRAKGGWDQFEPPPPLPEPTTDWMELVGRAVRNARPKPGWKRIRWACVTDALGVDPTLSLELCREFGVDPQEEMETPEEE